MTKKEKYIRTINALKQAVVMEAHIMSTINKFKHYKRVDSRFVNAIKENGLYHSYIVRDNSSISLVIYPNDRYTDDCHFSHRVYNHYENPVITWESIQSELERYAYQRRLTVTEEYLECYDTEIIKFKELFDLVNSYKFKCFSLYSILREMESELN